MPERRWSVPGTRKCSTTELGWNNEGEMGSRGGWWTRNCGGLTWPYIIYFTQSCHFLSVWLWRNTLFPFWASISFSLKQRCLLLPPIPTGRKFSLFSLLYSGHFLCAKLCPSPSLTLVHFILTLTPWERFYYCPHFTDNESEAQSVSEGTELRFKLRMSGSRVQILITKQHAYHGRWRGTLCSIQEMLVRVMISSLLSHPHGLNFCFLPIWWINV